MKPYTHEQIDDSTFIRTFTMDVDPDELEWHRDRRDRLVDIVEGNDWCFQLDNELPILLKKGQSVFIPKETYHRIIKGTTPLTLHIQEL